MKNRCVICSKNLISIERKSNSSCDGGNLNIHHLVGTYRLHSHGIYGSSGEFKPTSNYLRGEIHYGEDSSLSVLILFSETPKMIGDVLGYVGTYKVKTGSEVEHHFSVATRSSRMGESEIRTYEFREPDILVLSTELENGKFEAVWQRQD